MPGPSAAFPPALSRLYRNTGGGFVEITDTPVNTEIRGECGMAADIDGDGLDRPDRMLAHVEAPAPR